MLKDINETIQLSKKYGIPSEDMLFIDLNLSGVKVDLPYTRVRFKFLPKKNKLFNESEKRGVKKYFFGLPVWSKSHYSITNDTIYFNGEKIGEIDDIANDTCDSTYPRRGGTVLNLNANSKSSCHGCRFCHTIEQTPKDRKNLNNETALRYFADRWLEKYNVSDFSHLIQVAIVTGCFGREQKVLDHLKMVRDVFREYGYNNEIFYFGSEITTEKSLDELKQYVVPFAFCFSLECFKNRTKMLRDIKAKTNIDDIKTILKQSKDREFPTNFSYVLGLEQLDIVKKGFEEMMSHINRFPIINIFQPHTDNQLKIRHKDAYTMDYYIKARKIFEKIFKNTNMRPRPWENYRGLWYLKFGGEILDDIRTP